MLKYGLFWRMAWKQLVKQRSQSLLSIIGGSIAVILIVCSVVFIQSFDHSGKKWLMSHFGPIDWALTPSGNTSNVYNAAQMEQLKEKLSPLKGQVNFLPIISFQSALIKLNAAGEAAVGTPRAHVMSFHWEEARKFDAGFARRYRVPLTADEAIVDSSTAKRLQLQPGDVTALTDDEGNRHLFRIRTIAEPLGLTGFRGVSGATSTVLISDERARAIAGLDKHHYHALLAGRTETMMKPTVFPLFPDASLFETKELKKDAADSVKKLKMTYGTAFILLSSVAVFAGFLLMMQMMTMSAESHREQFGIFRAIGLSKAQVRNIFLVEAFLISLAATVVGTALGSGLGFTLVTLFEQKYGPALARSEGYAIPIIPYVTPKALLITVLIVLIFLMGIAALAAWRNGRFTIVELIRGMSLIKKNTFLGKRNWRYRIVFALCAMITGLYGYQLFSGEGSRILLLMNPPDNSVLPAVGLFCLWIAAFGCFLYLLIVMFTKYSVSFMRLLKRLGLGPAAIFLAARYPGQNVRRTWVVGILFGVVLLSVTFTLMISRWHFGYSDVDRTDQTILGFGGQAGYRTAAEKEELLKLIQAEQVLQEELSGVTAVEPVRVIIHDNWAASSIVPVTDLFAENSQMKLSARDSRFDSDTDAWKEVAANPLAIIVDEKFMRPADNAAPGMTHPVYRLGQRVQLAVFENKLRRADEKRVPVMEKEAVIVGFAVTHRENSTSLQFYDAIYVNPTLHAAMKPYAAPWPDDRYIGEILFHLAYKDLETVQRVEDRFAIHGVQSVLVPYQKNATESYMTKQLVYIFVGFLVLSVVIGLSGLAIIQLRAVKERAKQLAMMRCIGISGRHIQQFYLIEGTALGWMGLVSGVLFGISGGYMIIQTYEKLLEEREEPYVFVFPWESILPVAIGILAVTVLVNLIPSRQALRSTPGDAIRSADI